jgi:hypothetical protein
MKKLLTTGAALATVFASLAAPAFAAAPRHQAPVANDAVTQYLQRSHEELLARPSDVVTSEGRVIGADPDQNIRTQLLHDADPNGF